MDFFHQHWDWISANPWGAVGLATFFAGIGWSAAYVIYQERLSLLKEKLADDKKSPADFSAIKYPSTGRHGINLLANSTREVNTTEWYSLRAEIPSGSRIHVELRGSIQSSPTEKKGGWIYSVGPINWTAKTYNFDDGGSQVFEAEEGKADLKIQFRHCGDVSITVYEGDTQTPWNRTIRVKEVSSN